MNKGNPFSEYIENGLNMDVLDEIAAKHMRRRQEAINELLKCLAELKFLLGGYAPYGKMPPKDSRD